MSTSVRGRTARQAIGVGSEREFYALNVRYFPAQLSVELDRAVLKAKEKNQKVRLSDMLIRAVARGLGVRGYDDYEGPTQKLGVSARDMRVEKK